MAFDSQTFIWFLKEDGWSKVDDFRTPTPDDAYVRLQQEVYQSWVNTDEEFRWLEIWRSPDASKVADLIERFKEIPPDEKPFRFPRPKPVAMKTTFPPLKKER